MWLVSDFSFLRLLHSAPHPSPPLVRPAFASFGVTSEERENYFVGRLRRIALTLCEQPWADFRSAFSAFELATLRIANFCAFAAWRLCVELNPCSSAFIRG